MADQHYPDPAGDIEGDFEALIQELRMEIGSQGPQDSEPTRGIPVVEPEEPGDSFDEYFDSAFAEMESEMNPQPEPEPAPEPEPQGEERRRKPNFFRRRWDRRKRKRKDSLAMSIFANVIYFVLVAAAGILLARFAWLCADDVLALTKPESFGTVSISEGDNLNKITEKLHNAGLINYPWLFRIYGKYAHVEDKVSPGVYELNTQFDYHALVNGMSGTYNRMTTTVTIVEGRTSAEIFKVLEDAGVCSVQELSETAANTEFGFDFLDGVEYGSPNRLDGYLFPDTYEFYLTDDPEEVLGKFLSNFNSRIDDALRARAETIGYNLREILTIASMLQEEAATPDEMPTMSALLYNRLNSESLRLLQMDSTVFYAADLMGEEFDTHLDNPYNTYEYPGLPPGPIDNPGLDAIRAALYPDDSGYYYFATGKDGLNHFYSDWDAFEEFLASDEYVGNR